MTYAAPHNDNYDDGLVHSHDWSSNCTGPGCHHRESRRPQTTGHGRDEGLVHEHGWARG